MPFYQPIEKGANPSVRETTRWVSATPISTPVIAIASSPVDSEASSSEDDDDESAFSSDDDLASLPPSPPASKKLTLPIPISPANSVSSSGSRDSYFTGTFLDGVFPRSTAIQKALPLPATDAWSLALFDDHEGRRIAYAKGHAGFEAMNLRENLVDLLDLADEEYECDQVVVVLEKSDEDLAQLLHSLLYVGGSVVAPSNDSIHGRQSSKVVLISIDV